MKKINIDFCRLELEILLSLVEKEREKTTDENEKANLLHLSNKFYVSLRDMPEAF